MNLLLSKGERDEVVQQEVVAAEDCMTPYTYIEENADGTFDLFIYSSAVQSLEKNEYQKIENALLRSDQKGFSYENTENGVKKYFGAQEEQVLLEYDNQSIPISFCKTAPKPTKVQFSNMYGDCKEAVCYEMASDYLLYTYPINKGVQFEYVFKYGVHDDSVSDLTIELPVMTTAANNGEYITFDQEGGKTMIFSSPLVFVANTKQLIFDTKWEMQRKDRYAILNLEKGENIPELGEVHISFSIQVHSEDMPDSCMYEKKEKNVYLSDRAVVGKSENYGMGEHYFRNRFNYFYEIKPETIMSAALYVKNLNYQYSTPMLKLYAPIDQWSSTQMTWETKVDYAQPQLNADCEYKSDGWMEMDMTEYVKMAAMDTSWMTETYGNVMICDDGYAILATSDSGEYFPYFRIRLSELPQKVHKRKTINDEV